MYHGHTPQQQLEQLSRAEGLEMREKIWSNEKLSMSEKNQVRECLNKFCPNRIHPNGMHLSRSVCWLEKGGCSR